MFCVGIILWDVGEFNIGLTVCEIKLNVFDCIKKHSYETPFLYDIKYTLYNIKILNLCLNLLSMQWISADAQGNTISDFPAYF
jgi:hypothetical protein